MQVTRLDIRHLRRFDQVQLSPTPGLNVLVGDNGAGKTSVLEALHLMAYGRSFRGRVGDGLVRHGAPALEVFVEWRERAGTAGDPPRSGSAQPPGAADSLRTRKAGLRHAGRDWEGRLDGSPASASSRSQASSWLSPARAFSSAFRCFSARE